MFNTTGVDSTPVLPSFLVLHYRGAYFSIFLLFYLSRILSRARLKYGEQLFYLVISAQFPAYQNRIASQEKHLLALKVISEPITTLPYTIYRLKV